MNDTLKQFETGQIVLATDGMSGWDPAKILSGPHEQLTTDYPMYLIEYTEDNEIFLAHASDLRHADSLKTELSDLIEEIQQIRTLLFLFK